MSKADPIAIPGSSPQYRAWLQRERRDHLVVRLTQLAILLVFLVLWEVLPKALIVNPVLTSYPSALWPTFLELLKSDAAAGQHPHTHLVNDACHRARFHRRDGDRHRGCGGAVVVERALQGARPLFVVANAMPKTALVRSFTSGWVPRCRSTACRSQFPCSSQS